MMAEENVDTSLGEETGQTTDTSSQETDVKQDSEQAQDSAQAGHPETESEEKEVNWEKRYRDLQADRDKLKERVSEFDKGETEKLKQQDYQKYQEEQQKRLDFGTYMEQFKDSEGKPQVRESLNAWMQAREDNITRNMYGMVKPATEQMQYLGWSLTKMLKKIAPEAVEEQMELEKKMKGVFEEMPSLRYTPDSLKLAEQIIFSKMSKKDREKMEKDLTKQIKKSVEQKQGVSIPSSKTPPKKDASNVSKEDAYKEYIVGSGRPTTKL